MSSARGDFETRSTVDLRKAGAHAYASDEGTDVWCFAYCIGDADIRLWTPELPPPTDLFDHLAAGGAFAAWNAQFELAIWNLTMTRRYGWPELPIAQTRCSMAKAYAMALPGGLDAAAAAVGLETRKDAEGARLMMQMARPRAVKDDGTVVWWDDEARRQRLGEYCKQDVLVEKEIDKRLLDLTPSEQALWVLDQQINWRGVRVDLKTIGKLISAVEKEQARLAHRMVRVTGGRVDGYSKVQQLETWVAERIGEIDGLAKADVTALLERDDLPPDVREALEIRREAAKSSVAKLRAMRAAVCADGRVRGTMQYHGAATGRWAGRRIQPQNFPRPALSQDEIEAVVELVGKAR